MKRLDFDLDWRFHLGEIQNASQPEIDESSWDTLDIPHDWSIGRPRKAAYPSGNQGGFFEDGVGWYRKHFNASESWQGQSVLIEFEGVYRNSQVWLNGHYLGEHPYGYTTFTHDLTPYLTFDEPNVLAVRVDNDQHRHSRWYSGSGIYRHVRLLLAPPVHIAHWGVSVTTPEVDKEQAAVAIEVEVGNSSGKDSRAELLWQLTAPDGGAVKQSTEVDVPAEGKACGNGRIAIESPALWDIDNPALYKLETELVVDGKTVDTETTSFGIRSFEFNASEGFVLNGRSVPLQGGCVHHDCGPLGAASIDRAEERKVEVLRASGYNAVRCAHNPPSVAFLDACDRHGMLVIDEAFDVWRARKLPYDYHRYFDDWWERDLDSMLLRDRNHPSIILWSIGNELVERAEPEGAAIAKMLADRVREVEPTRPITAGINGVADDWTRTNELFAQLDVCGYNYQLGNYEPDHERFPDRVIIATESFPPKAFEYWQAVENLPHVAGDFVWTGHDYLGEVGIGHTFLEGDPASFMSPFPWNHANCGDIDLCGFKHPQSYYRDILWKTGSPLHIAVHPPSPEDREALVASWGWYDAEPVWNWDVEDGRELRVDVYSACDEVELILNGKSMGREATSVDNEYIATFKVPYEPGELKAVGYNNGEAAADTAIHTTGTPVALRLSADRNPIRADRNDLAYICVEVVDDNDDKVPTADHPVYFIIDGPGRIAAVANSDPKNEELYRGNRHRAYRGRCLAVIQPTGEPGKITLRAQADGLAPAAFVIKTES